MADDKPTIGWMLARSSWLVLAFVPNGYTTWLAFVIVAIIARKGSWAGLSVLFAIGAVIGNVAAVGGAGQLITLGVYIVGVMVALYVNTQWLTLLWERTLEGASATSKESSSTSGAAAAGRRSAEQSKRSGEARSASRSRPSRSRASQPSQSSQPSGRTGTTRGAKDAATATTGEAARLLGEVGGGSGDLYDSAGSGSSPGGAADAASSDPIDVNTASARELQSLPGMSRRTARDMVRERERSGAFSSIDDFAARAKLQPHELVRLRTAATCSPPPRGPRSFGRRVDF